MAGGTSLCEQRTLKFFGGLLQSTFAVMGAVVSNPMPMNTTSFSGFFFAISTASKGL
jgi:hypothetical protein